VSYCIDSDVPDEQRYNIVNVELAGGVGELELSRLERHFSMTSACGVCGKATLEGLHRRGYPPVRSTLLVAPETLFSLPEKLRAAQKLFDRTGGLHAVGIFTAEGELVELREDVGRHNAMDKVIGWALMHGRLPLSDHLVLVSGRASFELVQKCLAAGAPVLCSVSAPSNLAVSLAREFGLTLAGFVRSGRFRLYSGAERVPLPDGLPRPLGQHI
jgi:FdhD protein